MFDILSKVKEAKEKSAQIVEKLHLVYVKGEAGSDIEVICTGNQEIKDIVIKNEDLYDDREALNDLLITAVNDAIRKSAKLKEDELKSAAKDALPNMPGLGNLFG